MVIDLNSIIPLATIIGAAAAPTIAAIWAEGRRTRGELAAADRANIAAMKVAEVKRTLVTTAAASDAKLDTIHGLVNDQLTQAVNRFALATAEIEKQGKEIDKLKDLLKERGGGLDDQ